MRKLFLNLFCVFACLSQLNAQSSEKVTFNEGAVLTVYQPEKPNGIAIVICPGGGYEFLAKTHEGSDMAQWMNGLGVTFGVLEYRLPNGRSLVPLTDAEEALRQMRKRVKAPEGVKPLVGIMGASAGGHLAASLATMHRTPDSRPDFQILLYPVISLEKNTTHGGTRKNLIGADADEKTTEEFSPDKHVTADTPPALILLSDDDGTVKTENSIRYYRALHKNHVSASLHIYPTGGHGWGFRDSFIFKRQWTEEVEKWLSTLR